MAIAVTQLDADRYEVALTGPPETLHIVTLRQADWVALTERRVTPEGVLMEAFRFLLEREPGTSILGEFELSVIGTYFPEWDAHIRDWIARGA